MDILIVPCMLWEKRKHLLNKNHLLNAILCTNLSIWNHIPHISKHISIKQKDAIRTRTGAKYNEHTNIHYLNN